MKTLKKNYEYNYVFNKGKKINGQYVSMFVVGGRVCPRFGFVVSKKIGKAVVRNKVRRQLKEIVRTYGAQLQAKQFVFLAKEASASCKFLDLKQDVVRLLRMYETV